MSDTTHVLHDPARQPRGPGLPARPVRQHRRAGHRPDALVLVQLRPAGRRGRRSCCGTRRPGRCRPTCGSGRRSGTASSSQGPLGSFYLREPKRPLLFLAGGTGLAPFLSMLDKLGGDGAEHPVHLIYGVTNDADLVKVDELEQYAKQLPNFTFTCCVADEVVLVPEQGLRHPLHRAAARQRRRRGRLPLRSAADGRRGPAVAGEPGHRAAELLLREVHRNRPGHRDRLGPPQGRRRRRGVRRPDGARARAPRSSTVGRLSDEQIAEYRRLAEATEQYIGDGPLHRRGRLPGDQRGVPPVPDRGDGQRHHDRGVQAAAGPGLHGPGADARRSSSPPTSPRTTATWSTRSPAGTSTPRGRPSSPTPSTPRRRCAPASRRRPMQPAERRTDDDLPRSVRRTRSWSSPARRRASGRPWPPGRRGKGARSPWWTARRARPRGRREARERGRADRRARLGPRAVPGCLDRDGRGPQPVRPDRHPDQQRGRHDLGEAVRALHGAARSRPRSGARCSRPCGAAGRCCRSCSSSGAARSSTSRRWRPAGSTACPYAAAKGGVNALTASLACEYADHGHPGRRHRARGYRGARTAGRARAGDGEDRAGEGVVPGDRRPDGRRRR